MCEGDCNECKDANSEIEKKRREYLPKSIKTLFVAESPPSPARIGYFFYSYESKSALYEYMKIAMERAGLGGSDDFLEHFKSLGWYLDDLILIPVKVPVNKDEALSDSERKKVREKARKEALETARTAEQTKLCLAKRIEKYQPLAIVPLILRVEESVHDAAVSGFNNAHRYSAVHFPRRCKCSSTNRVCRHNGTLFLEDMEPIISALPKQL
jgi:hypothetical protein